MHTQWQTVTFNVTPVQPDSACMYNVANWLKNEDNKKVRKYIIIVKINLVAYFSN